MKNKLTLAIFGFLIIFIFNTSFVFAQGPQGTPSEGRVGGAPSEGTIGGKPTTTPIPKLDNPIRVNDIQSLLFTIVDIAIFLGAIIAVFMFLWIGFKFVMARGNESEIKEAKDWFLYAVIGTAILISSKVIVEVVKNTFIASGIVDKSAFEQIKK